MSKDSKTCPSAQFKKGSLLIGVRNEKDEMDILENPIKVNQEIHDQLSEPGTKPEKALRFANKCVQSGCKQWTGTKCGVIDKVLNDIEENFRKATLPTCAIRDTCRWFSQRGAEACKVCPMVTTYKEQVA